MFHVKHNKEIFKLLYELALKSAKKGDIPVSAIIIYNDKIIGKGYNNRQNKNYILGHAEVNAIFEAEKHLNDWRLNECTLITTLKPCDMCAEIINSSRISKVYYLFDQDNTKYNYSFEHLFEDNEYVDKYKQMFDNFFKNLR